MTECIQHRAPCSHGRCAADLRVAIVGGGLAGMAAAVAAIERGFKVELFEQARHLGGRAGSFQLQRPAENLPSPFGRGAGGEGNGSSIGEPTARRPHPNPLPAGEGTSPQSGQWLDLCPHVALGCCTSLANFCRRTGVSGCFQRHRTFHFFGPDARQYDFCSSRWLPAPLHLLPGLMRLGYLTLGERWSIARALMRLARAQVPSDCNETIGQWLVRHGQSGQAIERFWSAVLVSALGETVQRASLAASRKVFCDGFLASRTAYEMETATVPLGEIWRRVGEWLSERGAVLHLGAGVRQIVGDGCRATGLVLRNGVRATFDVVISAVPWRQVARLLDPQLLAAVPTLRTVDQIEAAPITAVHLWFDRAITPLPHAALIGRLSQWVFATHEVSCQLADTHHAQNRQAGNLPHAPHHYAVVISASRGLRGRERSDILAEVRRDLEAVFPAAREAELQSFRILTQPAAVFSVLPGLDRLRPPQRTPVPNLFLAGDWTATGWPATMEGAVRSGNLAVEALLASTPSLQGEKMLEWDSGQ